MGSMIKQEINIHVICLERIKPTLANEEDVLTEQFRLSNTWSGQYLDE